MGHAQVGILNLLRGMTLILLFMLPFMSRAEEGDNAISLLYVHNADAMEYADWTPTMKGADLSILQEGAEPLDAVVALMNPRLSDNDLQYDIKLLEGSVPPTGGTSVLFIDNHSFIGDTARGAAIGGVVGAIGGNAKKGAEIGAGVVAIHHAIH